MLKRTAEEFWELVRQASLSMHYVLEGRPGITNTESLIMWNDIKDAPKDGTVVDLWLGDPFNCRKPNMVWYEPWKNWVPKDEVKFINDETELFGTGSAVPTHFMIPPEGPSFSFEVDVSAEGLNFLRVQYGVVKTTEYFDNSHKQQELFHEFSLVQLALESGRAKISEDNKTAEMTITVPLKLKSV